MDDFVVSNKEPSDVDKYCSVKSVDPVFDGASFVVVDTSSVAISIVLLGSVSW